MGAPIVGDFYSPALIAREVRSEELIDHASIFAIATQSLQACRRVNANSLSTEGGAKSMETRRKEIATGRHGGPFRDHSAVCDYIEKGIE